MQICSLPSQQAGCVIMSFRGATRREIFPITGFLLEFTLLALSLAEGSVANVVEMTKAYCDTASKPRGMYLQGFFKLIS